MVVLNGGVHHEAASQARLIGESCSGRQREITTRTVPSDNDLSIVRGERIEVINDPSLGGQCVVMRGRERMLRGESVVY